MFKDEVKKKKKKDNKKNNQQKLKLDKEKDIMRSLHIFQQYY